jgi:uncharacterized PurR-regulated membrane protein YhhQ (DUF165 family)
MIQKNDKKEFVSAVRSYRCLPYIVAVYGFLFILPSLLIRKMVSVPVFGVIPISILFTGTYFVLLDVVTEVYGYREGRRLLFAGLLSYTVFVFVVESVLHIPNPTHYKVEWSVVQDADAYQYLFSNLYLVWFSVVFCALLANTLNMIVLSKWKVLLRGRYFWMRSVTTSFFAALLYSFVSNLFAFGLFLHTNEILYFINLVLISVSAKLCTLIICAYPATLLCYVLKRIEGVDVYDAHLSFNPFASLSK